MKDKATFIETGFVEIFKAGDYGAKGNYTTADLNDMAAAINTGAHIVPVVIGHETDPKPKWDKPLPPELADGALKSAKVDGDILSAKASVTDRVAKYFENHQLLTWSPGVYRDFKGTGKRAIRHLAALGKNPPHNKGLKYKPAFTFEEDQTNGEFNEIEFQEDNPINGGNNKMAMTLEEALKEIEVLKGKLKARAGEKFDEVTAERDALDTQAKDLKTKLGTETKRADDAAKELGDVKTTAAFAEIETKTEAFIKKGYPTALHDKYRAYEATRLGLVGDDGKATFAEGKSMDIDPVVFLEEMRTATLVPLEDEGTSHAKKADIETFSESELGDVQAKRMKLADEKHEALKKENPSATFAEASQAVMNAHPELYPDM